MSGYDWCSGMSNRAVDAYAAGELPASKAAKEFGFRGGAATVRKCLEPSSWHHTSKYFNDTDFFDVPAAIYDAVEESVARSGGAAELRRKLARHLTRRGKRIIARLICAALPAHWSGDRGVCGFTEQSRRSNARRAMLDRRAYRDLPDLAPSTVRKQCMAAMVRRWNSGIAWHILNQRAERPKRVAAAQANARKCVERFGFVPPAANPTAALPLWHNKVDQVQSMICRALKNPDRHMIKHKESMKRLGIIHSSPTGEWSVADNLPDPDDFKGCAAWILLNEMGQGVVR